jgi:Outer membrane protein beta-barrel domain
MGQEYSSARLFGRRWPGAARIPALHRELIINKIRTIAAALLAATTVAAQAQSENLARTPIRLGFQFGAVQGHSRTEPVTQVTLGYEIDRTFSVEALANITLLLVRMGNVTPGEREFNRALGARALAALPLGERWNLVGGLGVVQFADVEGTVNGDVFHRRASPLVSASLMYRTTRRWSFGAEVASFTSAHATSMGLRAELRF